MCIRRRPLWISVWDWRRIGRTAVPVLREPSSTIDRFSKRIGVPVSAPVEILITTGDPEASYSVSRLVFRSEEHTSELQSHSDLVCRLLLEKKKKQLRTIWHVLLAR